MMEDNATNLRRSLDPTPTQIVLAAGAVIALMIIAAMAISGFYQVKPGEATAVQTFGAARPEPETQEGLHWHWPSPIGRTTTVQADKSRTAEIGYQTLPDDKLDMLTGENWQRDLAGATMITGDLNLLEIQLVAQYYISDLNAYLFEADDPGIRFDYIEENSRSSTHQSHPEGRPDGQSIKDAMEIAIRRSIGHRTIDRALITDRETIELETMVYAQEILDTYRTGLTITAVQLQEIKPPDEVQESFNDVLRAREEKDRRINEALAFESQTLPEARGEAERIRQEAQAYKQERINAAEGEALRFEAVLGEYQASPEIIAQRMYLETLDEVLPRTKQVLIPGGDVGPLILNTGELTGPVIPTVQP